jgi:methylmalonyl-CoA mutase, N-terminal domain
MRNVREAGCTAVQEIAFGITQMLDLLGLLAERGLKVDQVAPRTSWFVNATSEFFEEVAKFRAMRRLWAKTMKNYGAQSPSSMRLRMHCQTHAPSLTYQQPLNNIVRTTICALAAVIGGVQSLHVNSFDEALATPSEISASLSIRTQQVIYYETGIPEVIDPLGGSYYIEWLTDKLEEEAAKIIDKINSQGGYFKSTHWIREQISEEAYKHTIDLETKKKISVGVNQFVDENDRQLKLIMSSGLIQDYNPSWREAQIARLRAVRERRDQAKCQESKKLLYESLKKRENMMPALIQASKCCLTAGEVGRIYEEVSAERWDFYDAMELIQHT